MRTVPAVEKVLQALGPVDLPRPAVVAVVRSALAALRAAGEAPAFDAVVAGVRSALDRVRRSRLQPVINGTGVLLHTNLGRAPLGAAAVRALVEIAPAYTNLEIDLDTGERGPRAAYLERHLALLCRAEAATVVNNCAAALVLILRHFTAGPRRDVVISRGELVQIGGGFRIPDILETSGARLREVGTTNRTTLDDYAAALTPDTALILRVHRSNFFMGGFVESPDLAALAALARRHRLPLVEDLGSGAVTDTRAWGATEPEPRPADRLRQGLDLVCFSGDKLLGGPQAGIIAGRTRHVSALKRDPFLRALRCDKLVFAALQATVDAHLTGEAVAGNPGALPLLDQLHVPLAALRSRAGQLVAQLDGLPLQAAVGVGQSRVGGGTLPQVTLESVTLDLRPDGQPPGALAARLRSGAPPVVGYLGGGRLRLDLRTVFPAQDELLLAAIRAACASPSPRSTP